VSKKNFTETEDYTWEIIQISEKEENLIKAELTYEIEKEYNAYDNPDWNGYSIIDGKMISIDIIENNTSLTNAELEMLIELQVDNKVNDDEYLQLRQKDKNAEEIDYEEDMVLYEQSILFTIRDILNISLKEIMKSFKKDFTRKQLFENIEVKYIENLAKNNNIDITTLNSLLNSFLLKNNKSSMKINNFEDILNIQKKINNKILKLKNKKTERITKINNKSIN